MSDATIVPGMPIINYGGLRAFEPLLRCARPPGEESQVTSALAAIDVAYEGCIRNANSLEAEHWADTVGPSFVELHNACTACAETSAGFGSGVQKALQQTAIELAAIVTYKCEQSPGAVRADDASLAIQSQIQVDGIAVTHVPDPTIAALRAELRHQITEVRQMADRNPGERRSLPLKMTGKAWDMLWTALNESGIVGGVALHEGREVRAMNWSLMQNSPTERWYKDCYADVGIETSPLAYMHYDHDCNYAKIQVYLSDVDMDSAPFSYIPGSHLWSGSPTQQMIFKTLDMAFARLPKPAGDPYYRPRFKYPEHRREFLTLPVAFQGTSHFGDDVLPDTDLGRDLMRRERFVTSDVGNCMVFTGGKALHRGGMARSKERLVLQIGVSAVPPISWSLEKKSVKQAAAERVGGLLRAAIGNVATEAIGRRVRRILG